MDTSVGLTTVLLGEVDLPSAIHETGVPNLSVLPCGKRPSNPAELLTSPQFKETLTQLRGHYDFVLVDTPPLLAVTDPCVVAGQVDGGCWWCASPRTDDPRRNRRRRC